MNKKNFIEEAKVKRKKHLEKLTVETLAMMLGEDVCFTDTHYINERTQEIITKTIKKLKFGSEEIRKARRAFLDVLLDGAATQIYGYDDDYNLAKKNLKIKDEKAKAKEVLQMIERLKSKSPSGLTEKRNMECEPVCQMIAKTLLSKENILMDEEFIDGFIEEDNETILTILTQLSFNELFDQIISSLDHSYAMANEKNWNCRRDQIRMSQINNRLINGN